MKRFLLLPILFLAGCAGITITTNDGIAVATPLVSGGVGLILRNNPSYIPIASKVGADLSALNYADLTLNGINTAVQAIVKKEGGDGTLAAIVTSAVDSGLAGYLGAVAESSLAKDPNAQAVLQAFGKAITDGAAIAQANPKP